MVLKLLYRRLDISVIVHFADGRQSGLAIVVNVSCFITAVLCDVSKLFVEEPETNEECDEGDGRNGATVKRLQYWMISQVEKAEEGCC